jgi:hypothetical protein
LHGKEEHLLTMDAWKEPEQRRAEGTIFPIFGTIFLEKAALYNHCLFRTLEVMIGRDSASFGPSPTMLSHCQMEGGTALMSIITMPTNVEQTITSSRIKCHHACCKHCTL